MVNPYSFVPFAVVKRTSIQSTHKQFDNNLLSGVIQCTVTTKSPLCIKSVFTEPGSKDIYIPGSTLKGMIRTVMEALYGGCGFKIEKDYYHKEKNFYNPKTKQKDHTVEYYVNNCKFTDDRYNDSEYVSCSKRIDAIYKNMSKEEQKNASIVNFDLCPVCSLFGIITESGFSFMGRLSFEDTDKVKVDLENHEIPCPDKPRVYRRSFYFRKPASLPPPKIRKGEPTVKIFEGGQYNGRKFYLHSKDGKGLFAEDQGDSGRTETVYTAPKETKFIFKIHFRNLSETELDRVLFALTLQDKENEICHKLGYGKPVGMGSVKIKIHHVKTFSAANYENFEGEFLNDYDFSQRLEDFKEESKIFETEQYEKLKEIWGMPGKELTYPNLSFFGNKDYINITLEEFNSGSYKKDKKGAAEKTERLTGELFDIKKKEETDYTFKKGGIVKGIVQSIEGLNGVAKLKTGEVIQFKLQNKYIHVEEGQTASFRITKITKDGKIFRVEYKK